MSRLGPGRLDLGNTVVKSRGGLILEWSVLRERWEAYGNYLTRKVCKKAGFKWDGTRGCWYSESIAQALELRQYADPQAQQRLSSLANLPSRITCAG